MMRKKKFAIILLTALFITFFIFFQRQVKGFFYFISAPFQEMLWQAGSKTSGFFAGIFQKHNLKKENQNLQDQNRGLLQNIASLQELKAENESLKAALQIELNKDFRTDLAKVIGKDINKDIILINKGSAEGLSVGFPVVTSQKALVGKITEVYSHYSKVALFTAKDSSFDARISSSNIYGIVKGRGNMSSSFELVPRDADIKKGDIIISSSLGDVFPDGILAGQIKDVRKSDTEAFQQAELISAFDLAGLDNVFVVTNFK